MYSSGGNTQQSSSFFNAIRTKHAIAPSVSIVTSAVNYSLQPVLLKDICQEISVLVACNNKYSFVNVLTAHLKVLLKVQTLEFRV